jgi:hypothetical protein
VNERESVWPETGAEVRKPATAFFFFSMVFAVAALLVRLGVHTLSLQNLAPDPATVSCGRWARDILLPAGRSAARPYAIIGFSADCVVRTEQRESTCTASLRPFGDLSLIVLKDGRIDCYVPE